MIERIKIYEIVSRICNIRLTDVIANNYNLTSEQAQLLCDAIIKYTKGYTIAKSTNVSFFWSYNFFVDNYVLEPRIDTEIVIETVLNMNIKKYPIILDVGAGSGCISITLLNEIVGSFCFCVEVSSRSLAILKKNLYKYLLHNRAKIIHSNMSNVVFGKYDIIVSNPPYISQDDMNKLDKSVLKNDPYLSLYGKDDGLFWYIELEKIIKKSMQKDGFAVLEIGYNQAQHVSDIFADFKTRIVKDYGGNDRCIIIQFS